MHEGPTKCRADAERVHEACWPLSELAVPPTSNKGLICWTYLDIKKGTISRTLYGVKSGAHPNGLAFNFCPYCGEKHPGGYAVEVELSVSERGDKQ